MYKGYRVGKWDEYTRWILYINLYSTYQLNTICSNNSFVIVKKNQVWGKDST